MEGNINYTTPTVGASVIPRDIFTIIGGHISPIDYVALKWTCKTVCKVVSIGVDKMLPALAAVEAKAEMFDALDNSSWLGIDRWSMRYTIAGHIADCNIETSYPADFFVLRADIATIERYVPKMSLMAFNTLVASKRDDSLAVFNILWNADLKQDPLFDKIALTKAVILSGNYDLFCKMWQYRLAVEPVAYRYGVVIISQDNLDYLAENGHDEMLRYFLKRGATVRMGVFKTTPLSTAILLLEFSIYFGYTIGDAAVRYGRNDIIDYLDEIARPEREAIEEAKRLRQLV